ncbi:hypothetical protein ACV4KR_004543 [Salmonella enterica subsp. enterica serovar Cerro]
MEKRQRRILFAALPDFSPSALSRQNNSAQSARHSRTDEALAVLKDSQKR